MMRSRVKRLEMIENQDSSLSLVKQCELLGLNRSSLYYQPCPESEENLHLLRLLDLQYLKTPFYGLPRLTAWFHQQGYRINRKRVRRLMDIVGWQTIYRAQRTSLPAENYSVYPYLLKGLKIRHINQVWASDITYVPMSKGFMYLCAIIDLFSRYIVGWGLSNTMTAEWCRDVATEAISRYGKPEIFNTDQGSQFTSDLFTGLLKSKEIAISMDSRGRAIDNIFIERFWRSIKYENIYLHSYDNGIVLYKGIAAYINFYNNERLHQSLEYKTPIALYRGQAA